MQQRRPRLGDILDDYCPRERRITNHAVVAMIDETVKQTRCTTCEAEHEFKDAKVPALRRRRGEGALGVVDGEVRPELVTDTHSDDPADSPGHDEEPPAAEPPGQTPVPMLASAPDPAPGEATAEAGDEAPTPAQENEWAGHRRLIRATLPRPEGHVPERKEPEFTMREARFDGNRQGQRHRGRRQALGQSGEFGHFGQRQNGQGGDRNGNRAPQPGQRNRPGGGGQPNQRHGGRGPKRGR